MSLVFALRRELPVRDAGFYALVQVVGGIAGAIAAHAMFELPLLQSSTHARTGGAQWFSESFAAFGLVAVILAGIRFERKTVPMLVGLYITAAYWFTSSTSFANPAVAIARSFTDTFSDIRPLKATYLTSKPSECRKCTLKCTPNPIGFTTTFEITIFINVMAERKAASLASSGNQCKPTKAIKQRRFGIKWQ